MRRLIPGTVTTLAGIAIGLLLHDGSRLSRAGAQQAKPADKPGQPDVESRVERLEQKIGDQAHAMTSVAYHFDNLWFAGQRGNWPLAQFHFGETRSHLRWAVRIIPVRKDNQGKEVKLAEILQAWKMRLSNSSTNQLRPRTARSLLPLISSPSPGAIPAKRHPTSHT